MKNENDNGNDDNVERAGIVWKKKKKRMRRASEILDVLVAFQLY